MAGEIQLNSTTFATESGGTVTVSNVDSAANRQNLGLEIGVDVQQYDADTTKNDVANTFTANQIISVTDNTNAALRVTQLGTGNALVVEDETNPDSTPFVVASDGRVGIRKSVPTAELDVVGSAVFDQSIKVNAYFIDSQQVSSGDADDYKTNGFYRFNAAVSNLPTAEIYAVVIFGNTTNIVTQIATQRATTATYVRSFNTTWTSWASL